MNNFYDFAEEIKKALSKVYKIPSIWTSEEYDGETIKAIDSCSPGDCLGLGNICLDGIEYLTGERLEIPDFMTKKLDIQTSDCLDISGRPDWKDLIHYAYKQKWDELDKFTKDYTQAYCVLGYFYLHCLFIGKVLDQITNHNRSHNIDTLKVRYSDELKESEHSEFYEIENSLASLGQYINNIYKKDRKKNKSKEEIISVLGEIMSKELPKDTDIVENIINTAESNEGIDYIPYSVARKLLDPKYKRIKDKLTLSLDKTVPSDYSDEFITTYKDLIASSVDISDFIERTEREELVRKAILNSDLTDLQLQIINSLFFERKTYKEAGKELGISPDVVKEHRKTGLKKIRKYLKHHPIN